MLPTSSCWAARGTALTRRELLHSSPSRKLGRPTRGSQGVEEGDPLGRQVFIFSLLCQQPAVIWGQMHINLPGFYLQNGLADLEDLI